jgi:four helix bundle protein
MMNDERWIVGKYQNTMKENIVRNKSFKFALQVVSMCQYLNTVKKEFILSKQLLRSGTSIGANIREADNAESKPDFIHKMGIAQKETDETLYWLDLLMESGIVTSEQYQPLKIECEELLRIIRSIIISAKNKSK